MFLVMLHTFIENTDLPCVITETEEKAYEWIKTEMKGMKYNNSYHQIHKIEVYK